MAGYLDRIASINLDGPSISITEAAMDAYQVTLKNVTEQKILWIGIWEQDPEDLAELRLIRRDMEPLEIVKYEAMPRDCVTDQQWNLIERDILRLYVCGTAVRDRVQAWPTACAILPDPGGPTEVIVTVTDIVPATLDLADSGGAIAIDANTVDASTYAPGDNPTSHNWSVDKWTGSEWDDSFGSASITGGQGTDTAVAEITDTGRYRVRVDVETQLASGPGLGGEYTSFSAEYEVTDSGGGGM